MILQPLPPGTDAPLHDRDAVPPPDLPTGKARDKEMARLSERLDELATALHAERRRALLVVIQARDAGGKDGLVRKVFGAISPQFLRAVAFGAPTAEERLHDFLWRVHQEVPPFGHVGVFSRSHYEDVLAARVRELVPERVWSLRYPQINDFERMLAESGVTLLKLFLHISRDEQARRFRERLHKRKKLWKFDPGDLDDRARWDEYTQAYRAAFARCGTEHAPWYVVPGDDKPARDLLIARLAVHTLAAMDPRYPKPDFDPDEMEARIG
ncbi:MAG: polyphosphate:nucleotide phosphotransferase, family [Gemmatimonadetes bacterium]|nr:polyphosphate:nucleotide phosphotransferase, family [Gemmatimonadota bacterium]